MFLYSIENDELSKCIMTAVVTYSILINPESDWGCYRVLEYHHSDGFFIYPCKDFYSFYCAEIGERHEDQVMEPGEFDKVLEIVFGAVRITTPMASLIEDTETFEEEETPCECYLFPPVKTCEERIRPITQLIDYVHNRQTGKQANPFLRGKAI